jgi:hypothetical protein
MMVEHAEGWREVLVRRFGAGTMAREPRVRRCFGGLGQRTSGTAVWPRYVPTKDRSELTRRCLSGTVSPID